MLIIKFPLGLSSSPTIIIHEFGLGHIYLHYNFLGEGWCIGVITPQKATEGEIRTEYNNSKHSFTYFLLKR